MMFIKVLFPEPEGPTIATYSAVRTSIDMPRSAGTTTDPLE
jgi:hypothetical protein